jgi:hypothetical protein
MSVRLSAPSRQEMKSPRGDVAAVGAALGVRRRLTRGPTRRIILTG